MVKTMHILIRNGRVIDPASGLDQVGMWRLPTARSLPWARPPTHFTPTQTIDASGCWVLPGLVDLAVRLREPGTSSAGMLHSEMQAAVAGGVTSLVCPPDTDPVLDEQGLVEMLKFRAEKQHKARLFPMGALTQGLKGDTLTEMAELTESGCVAFGQADVPMANTQALARALAYATTFGFRCGCARWTKTWAKAWPPAAPVPRAWGWPGCRWPPKPLPCTRFLS